MKNIFIFDVESTFLHGDAFMVSALIYDIQKAEVTTTFNARYIPTKTSDWVNDNIVKKVDTARFLLCKDFKEMRAEFFQFYIEFKDQCVIMVDTPYPVETNFLEAIYNDDPVSREWLMPYPLIDMGSILSIFGLSEIDRAEYSEIANLEKHNPYYDNLASLFSLLKCLNENKIEINNLLKD